jgi:RNA polymerase-interacting CarD/CdnL/TRCF family regulator
MKESEKEDLIEIFSYLSGVHREQNMMFKKMIDVYSETLYVGSIYKVREAVEGYLTSMTMLHDANLNLIGTYDRIVENLENFDDVELD